VECILDMRWMVDGEFAVRKGIELTLTFEHRVCDGATAAGSSGWARIYGTRSFLADT
jgi:hypothetical protein